MHRILAFIIFLGAVKSEIQGQKPVSTLFEVRHITSDSLANGETDFKGSSEWMNTNQRIDFLNKYADYASSYFENKHLDKKIVSGEEITELLGTIKPQPLSKVRRTVPLNEWRSYGYKETQDIQKKLQWKSWLKERSVSITGGMLIIDQTEITREFDPISWRFKFECDILLDGGSEPFSLAFTSGNKQAMFFGFENGKLRTGSAKKVIEHKINTGQKISLRLEADLADKKFNLFVNNNRLNYYIAMSDTTIDDISGVVMSCPGEAHIDNVVLLNYLPLMKTDPWKPFSVQLLINEDFEEKPSVKGWQYSDYADAHWKIVDLPAVHGGMKEKDEDLYLRKTLFVEDFDRANLQLETIDPGGEVWVNGEVVAVVTNRHPVSLDVTKYLKKNNENLFAIRVKAGRSNFPSIHAPRDSAIGWFLGRTVLTLTADCAIKEVLVSTVDSEAERTQLHNIKVVYPHHQYLKAELEVNYYPWFPDEGERIVTFSRKVQIRPRVTNEFEIKFAIPNAKLWSAGDPNLYRVEVILRDSSGNAIDDFVTTTGIRTVSQKNGDLYINGRPEILVGAQIMGMRTPVETMARYIRSAPLSTVAEEMLMLKKMGANVLRLHVHAENDTTDGINDPRYAEFADQMGINLIWTTAGFMREGEAWNVDFEGLPKYIKQVFNHPSIVIWEASNHPNRFKTHDIDDTHDYVRTVYHAIADTDSSRLISPTTFWEHMHYANYDGTKDHDGNVIQPVPEFMAKQVTRGSQDAYTGYGYDWTTLRTAPSKWAASCLNSKDKAYFNFEHEESAAQPNWSLSKGEPWHLLHSYEWKYDEGSIGRRLSTDEWRASQAWQAFSAYESMKKQIILGYDGFSWCTLHGGANMGTYMKPLIDNNRHPKLAFYTNKMFSQKSWAASNNVDVVYGPGDPVSPVVHHLGEKKRFNVVVSLADLNGKILERKVFRNIEVKAGRQLLQLPSFRFKRNIEGIYVFIYDLLEN